MLHKERCSLLYDGPLREWTELRLSLLALGYSKVLFLDVICQEHGIWRLGVPEEQETYACPRCDQTSKVRFLCEGFTRRPLPLAPVFVEFPRLLPLERCRPDIPILSYSVDYLQLGGASHRTRGLLIEEQRKAGQLASAEDGRPKGHSCEKSCSNPFDVLVVKVSPYFSTRSDFSTLY